MRLGPVDHHHTLAPSLGKERSDQLPAMVPLQVQIIHVRSKAGWTHHHVRKRVLLQRVNERIISAILRNDNDAVERLISDYPREVISQGGIFGALDFEPQAIIGSVDHLQNALLQIIEKRRLVN